MKDDMEFLLLEIFDSDKHTEDRLSTVLANRASKVIVGKKSVTIILDFADEEDLS